MQKSSLEEEKMLPRDIPWIQKCSIETTLMLTSSVMVTHAAHAPMTIKYMKVRMEPVK